MMGKEPKLTTYFVVRVDGNSADAAAAEVLQDAVEKCFAEDISQLEFVQITAEDVYEAVEKAENSTGWKLVPRS